MSSHRLIEQLGLRGLIHVWGKAGSGKTMFASKIAADESSYSKVEWINTDSKQSFVRRLKQDIEVRCGTVDNVTVSIVNDRHKIRELILNLEKFLEPEVSLVVIDSLTRVLDMSHKDPIMWGREMIEETLPSLAGLVKKKDVNVILTSEARTLEDQTKPVHHKTISKWVDHEVHVVRSINGEISQIFREDENREQMGVLGLEEDSLVITPGRTNVQEPMGV